MGNIIGAIILGVIAIACFIFSYLQFQEALPLLIVVGIISFVVLRD